MEDDYVTFERAKLLKEKGFPQGSSDHYYDDEGNILISFEPICGEPIDWSECIVMPTLSLVRKWLREYKDIDFEIHVHKGVSYKYYTVYMYDRKDCILDESDSPIRFEKFENALSVAINEALKMI